MNLHRPLRSSSTRSVLTLASVGAAAAALAALVLPTQAEPSGPQGGPPHGGMMEQQGRGTGGPGGPGGPGAPGGFDGRGPGGPGGPGGSGGPGQGFQQGPRGGGGMDRRPQRQAVALSGKVERYNLAPQGHYDAILLRSGEKLVQVNLPPDLGGMAALAAPVGSQVQLTARPELGMPDHPVYTLASLTGADGKKLDLDSKPKDVSVEGVVKQLNYSPVGDVNGVVLENGDFVHLGPEGASSAEVKVGQKIAVEGRTRGVSLGGNSIEAQSVNGKAIPRPPHPMGAPGMGPGMSPGMGPGERGDHGGPEGFGPGGPGGRGGPGGGMQEWERGGQGGHGGQGMFGGERGGSRRGGPDDRSFGPPGQEGPRRGGPREQGGGPGGPGGPDDDRGGRPRPPMDDRNAPPPPPQNPGERE